MKHKTPHHYARLLNTQKLLKARDEVELAVLKRNLTLLEQENALLATMMAQGSHADFVDPLLISQRMERNRRKQARLKIEIETQIKSWLQSSRRVERITEKKIQAHNAHSRTELAEFLGEVVAYSFHARTHP